MLGKKKMGGKALSRAFTGDGDGELSPDENSPTSLTENPKFVFTCTFFNLFVDLYRHVRLNFSACLIRRGIIFSLTAN